MNREVFPPSQSPLQGDISALPGATKVVVVGIQTTPFTSTPPTDGQIPFYDAADNLIEWTSALSDAILINGGRSGSGPTKQFFIDGVSDGASPWGVDINGMSD